MLQVRLMEASMLNADLTERVVIETNVVSWVLSPQPGVWRRMLERAGAESGRATSIVRFDPRSSFPSHEHPQGEEIFVLEGVFSDEQGDYPAGTYLLNPPGSKHAPASRSGCVLFVKLCQYAGPKRRRVVLNTEEMPWQPTSTPGISMKQLYSDSNYPERVALLKWAPHTRYPRHDHPGGEEILVLAGVLADEDGRYPKGTWIRNPRMSIHTPFSSEGCVILVRWGGLY
jgi:anti-sigma factor ChrR (cupin superfamily)